MLATTLSESSQQEPQEMMRSPGLRPIHFVGVSLNSHTSSGVSLNTSSANVPLSHHCLLRASYAPMAARFLRPPVLSPNHFQRPASKITTVAGLAEDTGREYKTTKDIKAALYQELEGTNRGIFGMASAKKSAILDMVELLESQNPTPQPTDYLLDKVDGCWKLIYSSITILGVKRTKLGLRDFISLGDFIQIIDAAKGRAVNVIEFNVRGFNMLTGQLTIEASFEIASKTRVNIKLENSHITPEQLMNLFRKNYDLLLAIFNPDGWLEITYVDDSMRIGRDDKGNVFVVERSELEKF